MSQSLKVTEFTVIKWPPQSLDRNPMELLRDVAKRETHITDVWWTDLHLCDAIMSLWTKTFEQHLVEFISTGNYSSSES